MRPTPSSPSRVVRARVRVTDRAKGIVIMRVLRLLRVIRVPKVLTVIAVVVPAL